MNLSPMYQGWVQTRWGNLHHRLGDLLWFWRFGGASMEQGRPKFLQLDKLKSRYFYVLLIHLRTTTFSDIFFGRTVIFKLAARLRLASLVVPLTW